MTASEIRKEMRALGNPAIAEHSQRFFKTGEGEYGEGDKFLGIRMPVVRKQVQKYREAPLRTIVGFLRSPWHEERMFAVLSLAKRFQLGDEGARRKIYETYLDHLKYVNNWDLVDGSAHLIVGRWLEGRSRKPLHRLARSGDLWERRVAIISTYHFIKNREFDETLALAEILLDDHEDLIHKAVGWMLREVGNRHMKTEERFLKAHYRTMPRTMLRYAIEKFPESRRRAYLEGRV